MISEFEIWIYRGIIGLLLIVVWQFVQNTSRKQEKKNETFFDTLSKLNVAIEKLTSTLEEKDKLCKYKHDVIEEQLAQRDHKVKVKS